MKTIKNHITIVDIIVFVFAIGFFGFWIPIACSDTTQKTSYQVEFPDKYSEQIHAAYIDYVKEIDADSSDLGCELAEERLNRKVAIIMEAERRETGKVQKYHMNF